MAELEDMSSNIQTIIEEAEDHLPNVRYNSEMLTFLCHEMQKVSHIPEDILRDASEEEIQVLRDQAENTLFLVKKHARPFKVQEFCKVGKLKNQVEKILKSFADCLICWGLQDDLSVNTKLDESYVERDRMYVHWYLSCIWEGRNVGAQLDEISRREFADLIERCREEHRKLANLRFISDEDILNKEKLGKGGFGDVYKARWEGHDVAMKVLKSDGEHLNPEAFAEWFTEIELCMLLRHPNVVRVYGTTCSNAIVMEWAKGDLRSLIINSLGFQWTQKISLMASTALGLQCLHERHVVHRDVKPANFLVFDSPDQDTALVKITDFGLARVQGETRTMSGLPASGTPLWWAPEIHEGLPHDFSSDVFSFGLVMYQIAGESDLLYGRDNEEPAIKRKKKKWLEPCVVEENCPPELLDMMKRCIDPDVSKRPSMTKIVSVLNEVLVKVSKTTTGF